SCKFLHFGTISSLKNDCLYHNHHFVSGTIIECVRRLSLNNQNIHSLLTRSLAIFNSNVTTSNQDGKFTVTINLGAGVLPEDVKVTIKDHELIVDVKAGSSSGDGTARLVQEYSKRIAIPEDIKPQQVKSVLSPEGILKIEAPLPKILPERLQVIEIPVNTDSV
ncbi:unnamed protein product, partial [Allacma fusca]